MRSAIPCLCCLAVALASAAPVAAGDVASRLRAATAAHLFGYYPKQGDAARFDAGYRRHLQWHRAHRDPLPWYGWYVQDGARRGMFVDGSFGAAFAAFDARVDPAGDAADASRNVTAFADPAFRASYRLRPELSTGFPLEDRRPSARLQVFRYALRPGSSARFEAALRAARETLLRRPGAPAHTWYALVSGGRTPGFLLLVAGTGWADHDAADAGMEALLAAAGHASALEDYAASVEAVESESWVYREDLSYLPGR